MLRCMQIKSELEVALIWNESDKSVIKFPLNNEKFKKYIFFKVNFTLSMTHWQMQIISKHDIKKNSCDQENGKLNLTSVCREII